MRFWILLTSGRTIYRAGEWSTFREAMGAVIASVGGRNIARVVAADSVDNEKVDVTARFRERINRLHGRAVA